MQADLIFMRWTTVSFILLRINSFKLNEYKMCNVYALSIRKRGSEEYDTYEALENIEIGFEWATDK